MSRKASGNTFQLRSELARCLEGVVIEFDPGNEEENEEGEGSGGANDGNGGEGGEGEQGASGSGAGSSDIKDPERKRLSDEAARYRNTSKAEKERADAAEKRLRELEDKDKSELEKAQRDLQEATSTIEKQDKVIGRLALEVAFYTSGAVGMFRDAEDARRMIDLSDLKPDEEGNFDKAEIKKRCDDLVKAKPYLAPTDGSDGEGERQPGGTPSNGRRKTGKEAEATKAKLQSKFPALASRS